MLLRHLDLQPAAGSAPGALRRFVSLWADPGGKLAAAFPSLFLEFDQADDAGADLRFPCLFVDVHRRLGPGEERQQREELTLDLVEEVLAAAGRPVPGRLTECFRAIPTEASIGHLGLMLGRDDGWLRVNVKQLARGRLLPFLEEIGWPGDRAAAEASFSWLLDRAERVTVALDLRDGWQEGIGFEAFFEHPPARDPRWARLLHGLCGEGLATERERADLLEFPAVVVPGPGGPRWPWSWIVAAAQAPADHVPYLTRSLSHVKVSLDPSGKRQAKAYLGLIHEWRDLKERPRRPDPVPAGGPEEAIERGLAFLAGRITQGGWWRDFHLKIGFGDEWVTAFVACQLLDCGRPEGRALAGRAWAWLLRRQRPSGGWGFNETSPGDADSTAWGLRLGGRQAPDDPRLEPARAFLAAHRLPGGGVATYSPDTPLVFEGELLPAGRRAGWSGPHDCVTASSAPFLAPGARERLRRRQRPEGSWQAYWWRSDFFATALAAEALGEASNPDRAGEDRARVRRAVEWAFSQDLAGQTAFDVAWAIRLASLEPDAVARGRVTDAAGQLLSRQLGDGSWPAGAAMLFPRPWQAERSSDDEVGLDQDRCFTTAAVVGALCCGRRLPATGA